MVYCISASFFTLQLLTLYICLVRQYMQYSLHVLFFFGGDALLDRVKSKSFRRIISSLSTVCNFSFSAGMLRLLLSCNAIFVLTALLIFLTAFLPSFLRPRFTTLPPSSSHLFSVQFSHARVNQYSQSFIPFFSELWNSLPASLFATSYDLSLL